MAATSTFPKVLIFPRLAGIDHPPKGKMVAPELPRLNARSTSEIRHSYGRPHSRASKAHSRCRPLDSRLNARSPAEVTGTPNRASTQEPQGFEAKSVPPELPPTKCPIGMKIDPKILHRSHEAHNCKRRPKLLIFPRLGGRQSKNRAAPRKLGLAAPWSC